jgi:predicted nucleic acid-binding protein
LAKPDQERCTTMSPPSNSPTLPGAVVIDASVVVAICAKEARREPVALAELSQYSSQGYEFYAPGVLVSETLYVLCGKEQNGTLTTADYQQAIIELDSIATGLLPPPEGEGALVIRSAAIRVGYGCSRSADSIYIALAETLAQKRQTVLITFDQGIPKHAATNAPTVIVKVLKV